MHILYVEDEIEEQAPVAKLLRTQHHQVNIIDNVFDALDFIGGNQPDILLCDYSLGEGPDGLFVAENTRNRYPTCTIVMISCHLTADRAVKAIQVGADDFIQRPVGLPELLARIWSAFTRHQQRYGTGKLAQQATGPLVVNTERWTASWNNHLLDLTPSEFAILSRLAAKPEQVITFGDLWAGTRGDHLDHKLAREILKPHISNLRTKLVSVGASDNVIRNVRGIGYVWSLE